MKLQPFNLDQWLLLGKPDCVRTRGGTKVSELIWHYVGDTSKSLSGIVNHEGNRILCIWYGTGKYTRNEPFHDYDLMLKLEDKPKTFGRKK